jgi:hypothetical protein
MTTQFLQYQENSKERIIQIIRLTESELLKNAIRTPKDYQF